MEGLEDFGVEGAIDLAGKEDLFDRGIVLMH
jgi:hypothetical protein